MEKKKLIKLIAFLLYMTIVLVAGWYEKVHGYDWWMMWTGGILFLALLCMSVGGVFSKANTVNDSMRYHQYQRFNHHQGSLAEMLFYILLMLPLIYNMM